MKKVITALLVAGLIASLGLWIFFDHIVLLWTSVLSVLVKGMISALVKGTVFMWIVSLLQRWLWTGLPRLVLGFLLRIGVPHSIQRKVRRAITISKLWMLSTMDAVRSRLQRMIGPRTAVLIALAVTVLIGILAFVFMGAYVVWLVGPSRIFAMLEWLLSPFFRWLQNFIFRLLANTGLVRVWNWAVTLIPEPSRKATRSFWWGVIRRRRRFLLRTRRLRQIKKVAAE